MKSDILSNEKFKAYHSGSGHLFPGFISLQRMVILVVGSGSGGVEKIKEILQSAATVQLKVVAEHLSDEIKQLAQTHNITLVQRAFEIKDLKEADIVIVAVKDNHARADIVKASKQQGKLVYVADEPELSSFHLGHVVKKGDLKIAISTNGDSSAIANKIKEQINILAPGENNEDINHSLVLLNNGFIAEKDNARLQLPAEQSTINEVKSSLHWKKVATYSIGAFALMLIGHIIFSTPPIVAISNYTIQFYQTLDANFHWMVLAGFFAQLVDGALGMGYGVTSSSILLSTGINPAAISGSVHAAEMFASGASGYSHYKFGNVNKKLFKALLVPGIIGAVLGAVLLVWLGTAKSDYVRPVLAMYTLFMGIKIILNTLKKERIQKKFKQYGWLAGLGGFLDSFGGGGWGPIVTTTLITKGRSPRFVIGSVSLTEFFVTLSSAFTFFTLIGVSHWQVIAALVIGGLIAAPIAAKLAGKLPRRLCMMLLGLLVIFWSFRILIKVI